MALKKRRPQNDNLLNIFTLGSVSSEWRQIRAMKSLKIWLTTAKAIPFGTLLKISHIFFHMTQFRCFTFSWMLNKLLLKSNRWIYKWQNISDTGFIFIDQKVLQPVNEINYQFSFLFLFFLFLFLFFSISISHGLLTKCEVKWTFATNNLLQIKKNCSFHNEFLSLWWVEASGYINYQ